MKFTIIEKSPSVTNRSVRSNGDIRNGLKQVQRGNTRDPIKIAALLAEAQSRGLVEIEAEVAPAAGGAD